MINTTRRTIAEFDILGFQTIVESTPLEELAAKYAYALDATDHTRHRTRGLNPNRVRTLFEWLPHDAPLCERYIFSDSIFLVSTTDTPDGCIQLLIYAWRLMQEMLALHLPLRGGVSFGEIVVDTSRQMFVGPGLVSAHQLQSSQNWVGAAIDDSVVQAFPQLFSYCSIPDHIFSSLLIKYDVPFKDGTSRQLHTINWRFNLVVKQGTRWLFPESLNDHAREKINNALSYAKFVRDSGKAVAYENLPVELLCLRVGDTNLPFQHGDEL
ncbi:MAG: hypothetical protein HY286_02075 [Planctomycetes bacterium]|nr:hypothetical protein [Planctomycetota bacterium]